MTLQISLVIFDEFHERSLQADLALALTLDVQQGLRDDLKILVMSATLDDDALVECFVGSAAGAALDDDELGLCPAPRPLLVECILGLAVGAAFSAIISL